MASVDNSGLSRIGKSEFTPTANEMKVNPACSERERGISAIGRETSPARDARLPGIPDSGVRLSEISDSGVRLPGISNSGVRPPEAPGCGFKKRIVPRRSARAPRGLRPGGVGGIAWSTGGALWSPRPCWRWWSWRRWDCRCR
jgi:hypothetical protein